MVKYDEKQFAPGEFYFEFFDPNTKKMVKKKIKCTLLKAKELYRQGCKGVWDNGMQIRFLEE